ncbi:hypothetical protein YDYSY3_57580 [Paenibacillus chitinolyticus]|uniref:hypothetical protein n=1 Tax=Paenibacillus chitinolyticus TaxID=79263 RepID=UPI0026E4D407|nr:hypothetical protein [Paenibacillus chitinolyticus]GKS14758.1 hypothetical protein YDYSY3_57580 [Paenibacillus chitinolyticus]
MDLFVKETVFNPDLKGMPVHVTGKIWTGRAVNFPGIVTDVCQRKIEILTIAGTAPLTVNDMRSGDLKLFVANWTQLSDNPKEAGNRENS